MSAEIIVLNIPSVLAADDYHKLLGFVSEERRGKVKKLRFLKDAYRTLLGEALARAMIISRLGISNNQISFTSNEFGKPALCGYDTFHFNISHSGDWVAAFVSDAPVGIDVEEMKPIDMNIAESFLSGEEYKALMSYEYCKRLSHFYEMWTLKESYIKCKGEGLSIPLHSFSITVHPDHTAEVSPNAEGVTFRTYELDAGHKLAACSASGCFPTFITRHSFEDLRVLMDMDGSTGSV